MNEIDGMRKIIQEKERKELDLTLEVNRVRDKAQKLQQNLSEK